MPSLYVESSAVLIWLLEEQHAEQVRLAVDRSEYVFTARLTLVESNRALVRAALEGLITQADQRRLRGLLARVAGTWALLELTESITARAGERFPVEPVRSLDAIHLASALESQEVAPDLEVLSFDKRIVENLEPLGLCAARL